MTPIGENSGWIKMHRSVLKKEWSSDPDYLAVWFRLLIEANHADNYVKIGNKKVLVKRGQLLTGTYSLSRKAGVNRSKLRRILLYFKNDLQIDQQTTNKYQIITILNWNKYQANDQQMTYKRPTDDLQVTTNKNVKNIKNDKNIYSQVALDVLAHLNSKANKKFRSGNGQMKHINGRLKEGFSKDDLTKVVDWAINYDFFKDKPQYLRPATLFNSEKFESYLDQANNGNDSKKQKEEKEQMRLKWIEKERKEGMPEDEIRRLYGNC